MLNILIYLKEVCYKIKFNCHYCYLLAFCLWGWSGYYLCLYLFFNKSFVFCFQIIWPICMFLLFSILWHICCIKSLLSVIRKEKEEVTNKSQPKSIDLSLPGWGEWGGKNLPVSSRKKRRFIVKFPAVAPRKDTNKGNVIINEEKNNKVVSHQVSVIYLIIFNEWNISKSQW